MSNSMVKIGRYITRRRIYVIYNKYLLIMIVKDIKERIARN